MKRTSLNHVYRLVWNALTQTWVAVAETSRGRGKLGKARKAGAALAAALMAAGVAQADPSGGVVTAGNGSITQTANTTVVNQQSQNLQLQWQSFNLGAGQSVTFVQPSAQALAVNQILDTNGSRILGNIHANGQVWLINPNGVFFGKDAQVNVGGLVASTLNPLGGTSADGTQRFGKAAGSATGSVVNEGTLTAAEGGYIALLGEQVRNQGVVSARLGTVALGAGSAVSLNFSGNQLLNLQVEQSTLDNLASNQQLIQADGGQVFMSAGAKDSLLASAVNHSGTIEARTVQEKDGRIILLGGMAAGTTTVGGRLDASAPHGGNGGFIETSGATVKVARDAVVTTQAAPGRSGTWLLDPTDFNIEAGAGDSTSSSIGADTLSASLANGNVTIQTDNANGTGNGDIHINAPVSWATDNTLTLSAYRDININAELTATGAAGKLALEYGQGAVAANNAASYNIRLTEAGFGAKVNLKAGRNFSTKLGSDGAVRLFTVVTELGAENVATNDGSLQGMSNIPAGRAAALIALGADIDASATSSWNAGQGFAPIRSGRSNGFGGIFDGLGHTVTALTINRPTESYVGLFAGTNAFNHNIQNVGLIGGSVTGSVYVGALVGYANGPVFNSYSSAAVTGDSNVGGLVGLTFGEVRHVYATGNVTGVGGVNATGVGGLIGHVGGRAGFPLVSSSYATGNVSATDTTDVGGLVGGSGSIFISDSYATGNVTVTGAASAKVGGLVGNLDGLVIGSYSTGRVTSRDASTDVGGLVGAYANTVVPDSSITLTENFWDTQTSGLTTSAVGTGKTTAEMKAPGTFTGWNVTGSGGEYPKLVSGLNGTKPYGVSPGDAWLMGSLITSVAFTLSDITSGYTYNGQAVELSSLWSADSIFGSTYSSWALGTDYSFSFNGNTVTGFTNAGTYSGIGVNVLKTGFVTATSGNTTGSLTIAKKDVTVSGITAADKVYDGTVTATVNTANAVYTGLVAGEALSTTATGVFADKNASDAPKTVTLTTSTAAGDASTLLSNYNVTEQTSTTASIARRILTITATAQDKVYDGTSAANVTVTSAGKVAGDDLVFSNTSADFTSFKARPDANVGANKPVFVQGVSVSGADIGNYDLESTFASARASITPRAVTVSGITVDDKAYDGSRAATVNTAGAVYDGLVAGEVLSTSASGQFASKDASNAPQAVTLTATTTAGNESTLASNYSITEQASTTARITPRAVTVSGITAADKVYDGSAAATVNTAAAVYAGLVEGEALSTTATGVFADKNASDAPKTVALTTSTAAGNADTLLSNYNVTVQTSTTASIARRALTITAAAQDKVYDGTSTATVALLSSNKVAGDDLSYSVTSADFFSGREDFTKDVGTNLGVFVDSVRLGGADSGNYRFSGFSTTPRASITPRAVTVSGLTADDKVYDGTVTATVNTANAVYTGVVAGETLSTTATGTFASKNASADAQVVTLAATTTAGANTSLRNYTVTEQASTTARITPRAVTVSGITAADKAYDGSAAATVNTAAAVYAGLVEGEVLSTTATGVFADKNASDAPKTVALTARTAAGDASTLLSNYNVTEQTSATARIERRELTLTATAQDKVYDGTATASAALSSNGKVAGDDLAYGQTGASFVNAQNVADKNAGSDKTVLVDGLSLGGADRGNYALSATQARTTASITPATLLYVAAPASLFVGQPLLLTGEITGFVGGDTAATALTGTPSWTVVGNPNLPGATGVQGGGMSAIGGNYVFAQAAGNASVLELKVSAPPLEVQDISAALLQQGQALKPEPVQAFIPWPTVRTPSGRNLLWVENQGVRMPSSLLLPVGTGQDDRNPVVLQAQ